MSSTIQNLLTLSESDKKLITETLESEKCPPQEILRFIRICEKSGLDPISRQIYGRVQFSKIKKGQQEVWVPSLVIITGIDGFRAMAERTGEYLGQTQPEWLWCEQEGGEGPKWHDWCAPIHFPNGTIKNLPEAARVGVYRKGFPHPVYGYAAFESFAQYSKTDKGERRLNQFWHKMPEHQICKCSESAAFRKAFPMVYGGIYIEDEIRDDVDLEPEVTQEPEAPQASTSAAKAPSAPAKAAEAPKETAPTATAKKQTRPRTAPPAEPSQKANQPEEESSPFGDGEEQAPKPKTEPPKSKTTGIAEDQDWFGHEIQCIKVARFKGRAIGDLTLDELEQIYDGWVTAHPEAIAANEVMKREADFITTAFEFRKSEAEAQ